jgi:hypothetical protein
MRRRWGPRAADELTVRWRRLPCGQSCATIGASLGAGTFAPSGQGAREAAVLAKRTGHSPTRSIRCGANCTCLTKRSRATLLIGEQVSREDQRARPRQAHPRSFHVHAQHLANKE